MKPVRGTTDFSSGSPKIGLAINLISDDIRRGVKKWFNVEHEFKPFKFELL